jgi:hypothetical protein
MEDLNIIVQIIKDTHGAAASGVLAAISVAVYGVIKVLRLPLVQRVLGKISPKLAWASWPKWIAMLVVFVLTAVGALLSALALGSGWGPASIGALSAAVPAALGAMGVDAAVGAVLTKPEPPANP